MVEHKIDKSKEAPEVEFQGPEGPTQNLRDLIFKPSDIRHTRGIGYLADVVKRAIESIECMIEAPILTDEDRFGLDLIINFKKEMEKELKTPICFGQFDANMPTCLKCDNYQNCMDFKAEGKRLGCNLCTRGELIEKEEEEGHVWFCKKHEVEKPNVHNICNDFCRIGSKDERITEAMRTTER